MPQLFYTILILPMMLQLSCQDSNESLNFFLWKTESC